MQNSKKSSTQSSSVTSLASNREQPQTTVKKSTSKSILLPAHEYLGRLVTYERPSIQKSNSLNENIGLSSRQNKYRRSLQKHTQQIYEEDSISSDDDFDDLSKPFGIIRINDRHIKEIYRVPTPPTEIKRVYHRARSPKPKIIERIYVRRPAPEIIENIIEVPPEKVRIINKEKYLRKSKPIVRTKFVYLKPQEEEQQQQVSIPSEQYSPRTYVYPSQVNSQTISYTASCSTCTAQPQMAPTTCYLYQSPGTPSYGYPQY